MVNKKKLVGELPNWEDGVCRSMDPDLFFADESVLEPSPIVIAACGRCPLSTECLDWAMRNMERYGVWGGTTPKQREKLRRPITRVYCPGCSSEAIREEPGAETCLSCGLSWKI